MNGFEWRRLQNHFQLTATFLSVSLNLFLIYLVVKKSSKLMGTPYKVLLVCVSLFEIIYSSFDFITSPLIHSTQTVVLVLADVEKSWFSREVTLVLITAYCGCFGCSLALFAVLYIYRYFAISGIHLINNFRSWRILLWLTAVVFCGTVWGAIGYFTVGPAPDIDLFIRESIKTDLELSVDSVTYLAPHFYLKDVEDNKVFNWLSIVGMNGISMIVMTSCSTITIFGWKWYKATEKSIETTQNSKKRMALHNQLFCALVIQTAIPMFLLHFPLMTLLTCVFLDVHLGQMAGINTLTIILSRPCSSFNTTEKL